MDVKLTILVPDELRRKAKAAAALRGVTISEIVRDALEKFVQQVERGEPDKNANEDVTRPKE